MRPGGPPPRRASFPQVKVTAEAARRFLVARHFLAPARSLEGGPEAVLQVFRKFGSIQFDPIAVAGRNHDLVLHARVAGYEPAWCDVLYERREIFEATNKALSFVPTSELPWFRHVMGRKGPRFPAPVLTENADVAEGVRGKRFVLEQEVALLEAPPEPTPSVAFIAPFDSLLWDTALLANLFDFTYVWEGFFPPAKRRWGYYVLPIISGDRFVGRIEPRIDLEVAAVRVLNVWWEDGFAPRRAGGFVDAMREALRAYLRFAGAERLDWAPHLATEKRLFLSRP